MACGGLRRGGNVGAHGALAFMGPRLPRLPRLPRVPVAMVMPVAEANVRAVAVAVANVRAVPAAGVGQSWPRGTGSVGRWAQGQ